MEVCGVNYWVKRVYFYKSNRHVRYLSDSPHQTLSIKLAPKYRNRAGVLLELLWQLPGNRRGRTKRQGSANNTMNCWHKLPFWVRFFDIVISCPKFLPERFQKMHKTAWVHFATLAIAILPGNWQNSGQINFAPYTMTNIHKAFHLRHYLLPNISQSCTMEGLTWSRDPRPLQ
jgi:hypothetical protein